ncbi:MFS transporter [Klebsiella grimontii]|uniref:MFS transporter n=1 Tax=Klebsiella grimontii TaxID=2058152 RepID=UPI0006654202|nr:MFS transporter [Klebsiella grimontii]MDU1517514.1 MFS transporter [Klebsiella michiganensis]MCG2852855.1 MFS transporter [Klebsiella grimontii]MDU1615939.1 MFS transporter [Klebsiella michiganensis]MEB7548259.1 MFS transporter [Klebsiella grimontii]UTJ43760.1 MFS transporter [Klebsiella grimontii]
MDTPTKSLSAPGFVTLAAGCNQLINWGISFYMPGTFARAIAHETGWAATEIYFGLTIAMLMMAMLSPFVARLLAHFGGQRIVVTGTLMISAGCLIMAYVHSLSAWFAAWALTGVGMRLALYDALFAALVNSYGQSARLTISRVTLVGGLASALFWPLGAGLLTQMDWRHALLIYALFGLLSAMLLWKMPNHKLPSPRRTIKRQRLSGRDKRSALLYASLIALVTFVSNGTSTHLPEFIASVGLPVAVGMLWGIGQTGARFLEVASGSALTPLRLTLLTTLVMPLCFALGLSGSYLSWAAGGFVLGYGAINGLTTVFKATLPLQLFAAEDYARRTGILLIPAQLLAAASPFVYAWLNHHLGMRGSLAVSAALALVVFGLAMSIAWDHREKTPAEIEERG